MRFPVVSANVC